MAKISVILPVYNGEKTLEETINSVLNQTFTDFELIVINAGSTDSTLSILAKFSDLRIQVFSYPRANVAVNRNRGFNHSCGKLITFIDADDLWTPDKLADQYTALINNTQAAVVYSWTDCIDEQGKFIRRNSYASWSGDVYRQLLLDNFIGSGSNVMMRREAFVAVHGFDDSLTNSQDADMWIRLASLYEFVVVEKPQIKYRILKQSMSSDILGLEKSRLIIIERAFAHPKSLPYKYLKRHTLGNIYKYLTYKALDTTPGQQKTFHALRFMLYSIYADISLVTKPIIFKGLIKLFLMSFFPSQWVVNIFQKMPKLEDTSTFLGYKKTV